MKTRIKILEWMLAVSLLCLSGAAHALFDKSMDEQQVAAEISSQLATGATIEAIARQTSAAGLDPRQVTTGLIAAGQYPAAVATVMIEAFPQDQVSVAIAAVSAAPNQAASILAAAITAAPQLRQTITTAVLILPGVNPAAVLAATGSGTSASQANLQRLFMLPVKSHGGGNSGKGGQGNCRNKNGRSSGNRWGCPASPA